MSVVPGINTDQASQDELAAGLASKADLVHGHSIGDVSGLTSALSSKVDSSDARLSDSRNPLPHGHSISDVTGLQDLIGSLRPVVLTQPNAASGNVGDSLSISCLGGILPNTHLNLTYQWQLSTDAGVSYSDVSGATSATIPFNPALVGQSGLYRCRVINNFGSENTNAVSLSVGVSIASLYTGGHQGFAWDLDQIGTLFQNSTATIPVTAYGDPVGRINDVSGNGNNLVQTTSSRRPTYARRPKTGVRNLALYSQNFANAFWVKVNATVSSNFLYDNTANNQHYINFGPSLSTGQTETFTVWARSGTLSWMILLLDGASTYFNLQDGTLGTIGAGTSASISLDTDGFYKCRITKTRVNSSTTARIYVTTGNNVGSHLGTGTGSIELQKAQFEVASNTTNYQATTNQFDVTESGIQDVNYLWFDGIDDCMQTASAINFSTSDEMTVSAGLTKYSDANSHVILETGALWTINGAFVLVRNFGFPRFISGSRGTINVSSGDLIVPSGRATLLLTSESKISADFVRLRNRQSAWQQNTADQGTGNYGTHVVNFGSRNQINSFHFGEITSGFVINRILNPSILADYERHWVGVKGGIDL